MMFRADVDPSLESRNSRPIRDRVRFIEDDDWLGALLQVARWVAKIDPKPMSVEIVVAKGDPNAG